MPEQNVSLKPFNTFGIEAKAAYFAKFETAEKLRELLQDAGYSNLPRLILGGGSNLLFTRDFAGLVLKNEIRGITIIEENEEYVLVKAGAGENWHQFVLHCISMGWAGLENLSLIPGNVGASPMQNIGAYGVEIKNTFHELEAMNIHSGEIKTFDAKTCHFGYRESIFKKELKGQFVIISVTYKLQKNPLLNTSYGAIEKEMEVMGVTTPDIKSISDAVIRIRSSKLPNPKELGNAGSFFKNPVIPTEKFNELIQEFPEMPSYPIDDDSVKVPAGWLIEQTGLKGKVFGNCGVHKNQALVLVNYGGASGKEIYDLSEKVLQSVKSKFGITLEREVNII